MLKRSGAKEERGVFIALEGTDGSGKGTQFELLKKRLETEGYEVVGFDFPQYDKPSSHFVRNYLNGVYGTINEVGPYTSSLFYALDRYEAAKEIRHALQEGKIVLANRFTGSSMAHQGTKFTYAEERRGFFIWLDNLEFGLLHIPRPDMNFVLRVPAEIAQKLVDKKEARTYTAKKRDLHEADLSHMQKSVEIYDDLCRLFPKDFSQLDCVRNKELMTIENIHSLLWEKVRTLLPPPMQRGKANEPEQYTEEENVAPIKRDNNITDERLAQFITVENISCLYAKKLEREQPTLYAEQPLPSINLETKNSQREYTYFTPNNLNSEMRSLYQSTMDSIFELHSEMVHRLTDYIEKNSSKKDANNHIAAYKQARLTLQPVLPLATQLTIKLLVTYQTQKDLVAYLQNSKLVDSRAESEKVLTEVKKSIPDAVETEQGSATRIHHKNTYKALQSLANQILSDTYSDATKPVTLTDVWPRNELDIIADILYEHSDLPLQQIRDEAVTWPYIKKQDIIKSYAEAGPCHALEKVHYSFDLLCDFDTLRNLQTHLPITDGLTWQQLTPRYGYEVPSLVEKAGLSDLFESCFDSSLELHSKLQAAGYINEAQYATLLGHRMRWKVTYNAREVFCIKEARDQSPQCRAIIQQMYAAIENVHPLLAGNLKLMR